MLRYHAEALRLAQVEPRLAQDAASVLAAVETRIGRALPDSVHEWYALEGACELLDRFSNADPAVTLQKLGTGADAKSGFLEFRHENQGVCRWAISLHGSDDPPVVVNYGDACETYVPCASTFSQYVYVCVWDWGRVLAEGRPLIQSQNSPVSAEAITFLRSRFTTGVQTWGWPGDQQYRFSSTAARILIWAGKDQADWWLAGDSEDALLHVVSQLWNVDGLSASLWSNDAAGESILQALRG